MILDDNESELLKQWVMKRLEGIEVDGDVMADYVLALVKTDDPEPVLRASSIENLQDFLQDGTEAFVEAEGSFFFGDFDARLDEAAAFCSWGSCSAGQLHADFDRVQRVAGEGFHHAGAAAGYEVCRC